MKFTRLAIAAALSVTMLSACSENNNDPSSVTVEPAQADGSSTIVDIAVANGSFNTLVAALQATGLDEALADETRQFTVFAPTDAAFAELGQETIDALLADTETLTDILLYHVLADQNVDSATAITLAGSSVNAANGDALNISLDGVRLFINESEVTAADVGASNGVIHVIDKVLLPPNDPPADDQPAPMNIVDTAVAAGSFNTLAAALEATDLIGVLADESATFTVFAPTDEAFAALGQDTIDALLADPDTLRDILLYHVIGGSAVDANTAISLAGTTISMANGDEAALSLDEGQLRVNMANVIATDVFASNGIIHVLDAVLLPPADPEPTAPLANIAETAAAAGNFNTLIAALQATGLDTVVADESLTLTVFAPTDAAFAKLGEDTINALLADPDTLADILAYHAIDGAVDSTTAISLAGTSVTMLNGDEAMISLDGDQLLINMSAVTVTDIQASNGIIHVIDTVLIPPTDVDPVTSEPLPNLLEVASQAGNFSILVAAMEATGLDVAIGHGNDLYTVFAPTDEAFLKLGQDTIDALLADPDTLRDILLYHVIAGTAVDAQTAIGKVGFEIEAANGERFVLNLQGDALFINDSQIIATDIRASNGIIHAIDAVLIPPSHGS